MGTDLATFATEYGKHLAQRAAQGIPPLPLSPSQTAAVCQALEQTAPLDPALLRVHGAPDTAASLRTLLGERVPPGVYPASKVKAAFLEKIALGSAASPHLSREQAIDMLGAMGGGFNVLPLLELLAKELTLAARAARLLEDTILVTQDDLRRVQAIARRGSEAARGLLRGWAEGSWFAHAPEVAPERRMVVVRTSGEINTDFFSPAQEASTRDDIPLHALAIFSTSPNDKQFLERRRKLAERGLPLLFAGDVVGTGSSRKSASNSLVWWIGEEIPHVPNKKRGGVVVASKIAPIFFNTVRGCGAIPIRCKAGDLVEGQEVVLDLRAGEVRAAADSKVLTRFKIEPASILDESRAGGRNNLIIGRKLVASARAACAELELAVGKGAVEPAELRRHPEGTRFTLAQRLVGEAAGARGVLPGDYVEPAAHLVFSQDTTGKMTQQEVLELATVRFAAPTIQSFCHTAAGPKSKDARMQADLGAFVAEMGGIDLRPGDGVIHTNGNRFLLPGFVGTGGDSHTRFPIGISFPAGSDLVAFAASQGYFPLDMPESVLVRFEGKPRPGITVRDLVNAIPYAAMKQGKLNLGKGDAKVNVFADRILEIEGLEDLTVEEAYKLTDASAERSAAACAFHFRRERVVEYVENNLRFLENNFAKRHEAAVVRTIIEKMKAWLASPALLEPDAGASYAETVVVDLAEIREPLLAAPNDPDRIVTLSEAAGTAIDEVFVGSCMVDITDFRAVAAILEGKRVKHAMKVWTVPPDRESAAALAVEGITPKLLEAGANVHVPGCSLCMGNQAQVATGCTTLSTSTRNFDNRMGVGAQVYLGSAHIGAIAALLGRLPTVEEYQGHVAALAKAGGAISRPLRHA
jgi:aconitate hydratase 2 / 2-methylisocitrate dehydratase